MTPTTPPEGPQHDVEAHDVGIEGKRPRYRKKRYYVPAGLLATLFAIGSMAPPPEDDTITSASVADFAMDQEEGDRQAEEERAEAALLAEQAAADQEAAKEQALKAQQLADEKVARLAAEEAARVAAEAARILAEQAAAEAARVAEEARLAEVAKVQAASAEAVRQAASAAAAAPAPAPAYFANCTEVKAAGAAPIYVGDPGWQQKFDRDKDGVGCEN